MDLGTQVTIGLAVVAALVWAVRQEGRVNNHDELHKQHRERAEEVRNEALSRDSDIRAELVESKNAASARYNELRGDMQYFRQRFDVLFGQNNKHS